MDRAHTQRADRRPRPRRRAIVAIVIGVVCASSQADQTVGAFPDKLERVNRAFLHHLDTLGADQMLSAVAIRDAWKASYRASAPESFIPEALGILYPSFQDAIDLFDRRQSQRALPLFRELREHEDPYVAANATYFHIRALVDQGLFEEADAEFSSVAIADVADYTPYADHLAFIRSVSQARTLRFDDAAQSIQSLEPKLSDAPESVRHALRQLRLEIERRELGTLDEVATVMDYVAERLDVADSTQRVQERQEQVLELLDKLIEDAEEQEQQGQGGGGSPRPGGRPGPGSPAPGQGRESDRPREDSEAPEGAGSIGDLHAAPRIKPGEIWGQMPASQREKILQAIRERYPSRYRQLVEQYYRSLAEEK